MTALLQRFVVTAGADKAILYGLLSKGWRAVAGLISIVLIAKFLTPQTQGYYFTFQSLIALQVFVELGLFLVAVNITSHEWAKLGLNEDGQLIGDQDALSRLVSFGRRLASWYSMAAVVFVIVVGPAGALFLARQANDEAWLAPWLVSVFCQGIILAATPLLALLEGCNQVVSVQRFQLWQAIVANAALWICLSSGAGLWSVAALLTAQALGTAYYLGIMQRPFFSPFWRATNGKIVDWKREVWPMQWRLAVQGVVNYFVYSIYTPVIFYYFGPVEAGQFGLTWQVFSVLQAIGLVWVQTRVPRFGMLIAQRHFEEMDRLWQHAVMFAIGGFATGMVIFVFCQTLLNYFDIELGRRFLGTQVSLLLLPTGLLAVWIQCAAVYWRAHKIEPLGMSAIIPGVMNGTLVWWWGRAYGSIGAIAAYLFMLLAISGPLSVYLKRQVAYEYRGRANG